MFNPMYQQQYGQPTYQPINPYQQRLESMQQAQSPQSPQTNAQFVMVDGIDAARNTAVMPGQIRWMMNNDGTMMYVKAVDATGAVSMRVLSVNEVTPDMQSKQANDQRYVTGKEYDEMLKRLDRLEKSVIKTAPVQKGTA